MSTKIWQQGFLLGNDDKLKKIKIRYRGDNPRNWLFQKKNLRIKTRKKDQLGQFRYYGENSADEKIEYVRVKAGVSDVTDGTEDSNYTITTFTGGSQFGRLNILPTETVFNENSTDVDFRVESNGNTHMLFVDGGSDHVNIGTATDLGGVLNVSAI